MGDLNLHLKAQAQVPKVKDLCGALGFKAFLNRPYNRLTDSTHLWRRQYTTSDGTPGNQLLDWKSSKVHEDLKRMTRDYLGSYGIRHWPADGILVPTYPTDRDEIEKHLVQIFWRQNVNEARNAKPPPDSLFTEETSCIFTPEQITSHRDSVSKRPLLRLAARPLSSQLTSFPAHPLPARTSSSRPPYVLLQSSLRQNPDLEQRENKPRTITVDNTPDLTSTSYAQPVASKTGKQAPENIDLSKKPNPPMNEEDLHEFHANDKDADKSQSRPRKKLKQSLKYYKPSAQLPAPIAITTSPVAASTQPQPAQKPSSSCPNDHFYSPKYGKPPHVHDSDDCVPGQRRKRTRSIHTRSGSSADNKLRKQGLGSVKEAKMLENSSSAYPARDDETPEVSASPRPTRKERPCSSTSLPVLHNQEPQAPYATSLSAEEATKQEKPSPPVSFPSAPPAQKTTLSPSPAKPPRPTAKPHIRYTIVKSRNPKLSKLRWREGALVGKTVASIFDEIAELMRRPSIDRMNFRLATSQSDSEHLIRRGEDDQLDEMRKEFMQDMKADMISSGNTDFEIWVEPVLRDSYAGAGNKPDEINFDMW